MNMWTKSAAILLSVLHISPEIICYETNYLTRSRLIICLSHWPRLTQWTIGHTSDVRLSYIMIFSHYDEIKTVSRMSYVQRKRHRLRTKQIILKCALSKCPHDWNNRTVEAPTAIRVFVSKLYVTFIQWCCRQTERTGDCLLRFLHHIAFSTDILCRTVRNEWTARRRDRQLHNTEQTQKKNFNALIEIWRLPYLQPLYRISGFSGFELYSILGHVGGCNRRGSYTLLRVATTHAG